MEFEKAIAQLDEIVQKMESGKLSIDESLENFSKGIKLCEDCKKQLEQAKGKVTLLEKDLKESDFKTE